ncbi:MAG: hypothetical protein Ct9H300mP22_7670 [Gammaproteobacteria bacterium]|nr:MAG: hypothetical protein Ct9H300mP22_7670 [Gammaproteobacteria bacterium]
MLLDIVELGLPTSTEALDPISPQYLQDLIAWSQLALVQPSHKRTEKCLLVCLLRLVLKMVLMVGNGSCKCHAIGFQPHRFLGINSSGQVSVVTTKGNPYAHVVLRGGSNGPNYNSVHVAQCEKALFDGGVSQNIMFD